MTASPVSFISQSLLTTSALFLACITPHTALSKNNCTYSVEPGPKLTWTGYKFSKTSTEGKTPVPGSFTDIYFDQNRKAQSVEELITSIKSFKIDTATIDSGNLVRDKKLALYVFGSWAKPYVGQITGGVTKVDWKKKRAFADIQMNGATLNVPFDVSMKGDTVSFSGRVDMLDFVKKGKQGQVVQVLKDSYDLIHKACEALHTGSDGKSVTWTDVALKIEAKVKKTCV